MLVNLFKNEAMQSLAKYVKECVLVKGSDVGDEGIRIKLVKSVFVSEALCLALSDYSSLQNRIKIHETGGCVLHE